MRVEGVWNVWDVRGMCGTCVQCVGVECKVVLALFPGSLPKHKSLGRRLGPYTFYMDI